LISELWQNQAELKGELEKGEKMEWDNGKEEKILMGERGIREREKREREI